MPRALRTAALLALALAAWTAAYWTIWLLAKRPRIGALGLARGSRLGEAVAFFPCDTPAVLRPRLVATFAGVVGAGIMLVGWPFNSILRREAGP